ncbi:MAG: HDOD domain-containing protein [Deltaproteobacteria bacterium]|nr:HDOD domain-containing protein [Deltaproteobacteria bacterium]
MLGGLFGKKKGRSVPDKAARLSPAITSSIMATVGSRGIPPMPSAAQKAFRLSVDPRAEARDFIDIIESDEALSARVIKIANSVYYERGKKSETIEESVLVIGINELRNLLSATTLTEIFPSSHPARSQLWANDIATAIAAKIIARKVLPSKEEAAFLAGLMHDIGKLMLLQRAGPDYQRIIDLVQSKGCDFCEAEEEVFPFNHTEVGQLIGEKWSFTEELIDAIRNHHRPWSATASGGPIRLPELVKAADLAAHALGLGHPRGFGRFKNSAIAALEEAWTQLQIAEPQRRGLAQEIQRTYDLEYDLYSN